METSRSKTGEQHRSEEKAQTVLNAALKFREDLLRIECEHAFLHNELSKVCDDFIVQLNDQITQLESQSEQVFQQSQQNDNAEMQFDPNLKIDQTAKDTGKYPSNPFFSSIDSTGHYLESALDKVGDGIIFFFEAVLKLANNKADTRRLPSTE